MVVGGALVYMALHYHLIRGADGMHLVRKSNVTLSDTYVDIRDFGPRDWRDHPQAAAATIGSGKESLMQSAADQTLLNGLDRLLGDPNRQ